MAAASIDDILAKSGLEETTGSFVVLREDFSKVVYMVWQGLSEPAADFLAKHFNDLKHHQHYWSEVPKFNPSNYIPSDIIPNYSKP